MQGDDLTNVNESDSVSSSGDSGGLFSDSDINEESSLAIDSEIIEISTTDDILITLHQVESKELEQIEKIVENQIRIGNDLTTILGILYLIIFYIALKSLAKLFNDIIFRHF